MTLRQTASELTVIPLPNPIPSMGNELGANQTWMAPIYESLILRATDSQTSTEPGLHSWEVTDSGGSSDIQWNANGRLLRIVEMGGATTQVIGFNPEMLGCSDAIPGSKSPTGNVWSNRDPNADYFLNGTTVSRRTFNWQDPTEPPVSVELFDFAEVCPQLPPAASIKWHSPMWLTIDDSVFAVAFSDLGGQDTAEWLVIYQPASGGCQSWNTMTGQIIGNNGFGMTGKPSTFFSFQIHDIEMGYGGVLHVAVGATCVGCPKGSGFLWKAGGLEANWVGSQFGGHNNVGYNNYINSINEVNYVVRPWDNVTAVKQIDRATIAWPPRTDTHVSWKNVDVLDSAPFMVGTSSLDQPQPLTITAPLQQENVLVGFDGSFTRVCPTMVSGISNVYNFRTANAIGSISKQGYYAWSSDWMQTLGTFTTPAGTFPRSDVFVVIPQ